MTIGALSVERLGKVAAVLSLFAILSVGGCKKFSPGGKGIGDEDGSGRSKVAGCPEFATTSPEPVLLRYKCQPNQKIDFGCDMDMVMRLDASDGRGQDMKMNMTMNMKMDGMFHVTEVDSNGDFRAVMTITRITTKMDMEGGPGGAQKMDFDSDKDRATDRPEMRPLRAMLNQPVPVKISAMGQLLEADVHALASMMGSAASTTMNAKQSIEQILKSSFVQLSKDPVKAGDTYDAGELSMGGPGGDGMKAKVRYKILSVSGDKKQAVLQPLVDFSITKIPGAENIKMESCSADGWILFDVERGNIVRSAADIRMAMAGSEGRQSMRMEMQIGVRFDTAEKAGRPAPQK